MLIPCKDEKRYKFIHKTKTKYEDKISFKTIQNAIITHNYTPRMSNIGPYKV